MAKTKRRPNAYQPERYNKHTLHDDREYGFFWYEWLWRILRPVLVFMCSLLIVIGLVTTLWNKIDEMLFQPVEPGSNEYVQFVIESGDSITTIGNNLEKSNLLRNSSVFKYIVQFQGLTSSISYGTYELSPGMGVNEIIAELSSGSQTNERTITIIPGWTVEDIADYLVKEGAITSRDEFIDLCNEPERFNRYSYALDDAYEEGLLTGRRYALEGYLAPDTYRVFRSADAESIIRTLLTQGNTVVDRVFYTDHSEYTVDEDGVYTQVEQYDNPLSMDEIIILASMIEKEAGTKADYAKVSAVFHNRIAADMKLESDATINYITRKTALILSEGELEIESSYNTYYTDGLPTGPICNPSQAALEAALYPDMEYIKGGYMYFCAKEPDSGELAFAVTKAEHEANVELYRPAWQAYDELHSDN
ncbi:MAG: endolytic transglycosylase MltG [Clostridia bacterium]|nr:endolytic transglycosylase MltG [Clostridia bacterium]